MLIINIPFDQVKGDKQQTREYVNKKLADEVTGKKITVLGMVMTPTNFEITYRLEADDTTCSDTCDGLINDNSDNSDNIAKNTTDIAKNTTDIAPITCYSLRYGEDIIAPPVMKLDSCDLTISSTEFKCKSLKEERSMNFGEYINIGRHSVALGRDDTGTTPYFKIPLPFKIMGESGIYDTSSIHPILLGQSNNIYRGPLKITRRNQNSYVRTTDPSSGLAFSGDQLKINQSSGDLQVVGIYYPLLIETHSNILLRGIYTNDKTINDPSNIMYQSSNTPLGFTNEGDVISGTKEVLTITTPIYNFNRVINGITNTQFPDQIIAQCITSSYVPSDYNQDTTQTSTYFPYITAMSAVE